MIDEPTYQSDSLYNLLHHHPFELRQFYIQKREIKLTAVFLSVQDHADGKSVFVVYPKTAKINDTKIACPLLVFE